MARGTTRTNDVPAKVFNGPEIVLDARNREGVVAAWTADDGTPRGFRCGFEVDLGSQQVLVLEPLYVGVRETGYRVHNGSLLGSGGVTRLPGCLAIGRVEIPVLAAESLRDHLERANFTTRLNLRDLRVEVFC